MLKSIVLNFLLLTCIDNLSNVSSKNNNCKTLIPGMIELTRGIDVTASNFKAYSLNSNTGSRHSVFDLTCDEQKTWSISEKSKAKYDLPDQLLSVSMLADQEPETRFNHAFNDFPRGNIRYSRAESYKEIMKQFLKLDKYIFEIFLPVSVIEIHFNSKAKQSLNGDFVEFVSKLSDKYEDDPAMYRKFIDKFGTQYITRGKLCGLIYQRSAINREYFYKTGLETISQKLMEKFRKIALNEETPTDHFNYAEFELNTETQIYQHGSVNEINRLVKNQEKVLLTDLRIYGAVYTTPISQLIANKTIRDQVDKAVLVYQAVGYFQELQRAIYMSNYKLEKADELQLKTLETRLNDPKTKESDLSIIQIWNYYFDKIQETIDRRYLRENLVKIDNFLSVNEDKYSVKSACKSESIDKITILANQNKQLQNLKVNGTQSLLYQQSRPGSEKVLSILVETAKLLNAMETELVGWCAKKN